MMIFVLRKILYGLRTVGPRYLLRVVPNELARPRLALTRHIRTIVIAVGDRLRRRPTASAADPQRCLQFIYDLGVAPLTFDFATYLAAAEIERRRRGLDGITVLFVLGPHHGVRQEQPAYEAAIDHHARLWRLRHILIPMLAFVASVRGHAVCAGREQARALIAGDSTAAHVYPPDYRLFLPCQPAPADLRNKARAGDPVWPLFRATEHGRRLAGQFFARHAGKRRVVVVTLRQSVMSPARNSRTADWLAFADELDPQLYLPIFIRDSDTVMREPAAIQRHMVCDAAAWNLELRMALYERAWLNMAVMHGPMELCWYCEEARYLLFVPIETDAVTSPDVLNEAGHRIGQDLEFATPGQHLVWEADSLAAIRTAFAAMEKQLVAMDGGRQPRSGGALLNSRASASG
jgi:hypothetical protein